MIKIDDIESSKESETMTLNQPRSNNNLNTNGLQAAEHSVVKVSQLTERIRKSTNFR